MAGGKVLNTKTRGGNRQQPEQTTGEKIKDNQRRLHAERQKAGVKKYKNGNAANGNGNEKAVKKFESYRREEQLPRHVEDKRIYVDETRQSVVLPVYGYAVPFHISTIKNVIKTEGTDHMVLRINFQTPGQIAGKKEDMVSSSPFIIMGEADSQPFADADATFVRQASFRSTDERHMLKVYEQITALKKAATKREAEKKEMADVVEQDRLIEAKGKLNDTD